jgi:CheY-like chemotaxis protein
MVHTDIQPGDYAMIEINDTGTGMTEEVISHIFEPFFTTKAPGKGTGLGLSMVFGFMKQSGGHINVYSEVQSGTTVRLYLPRDVSAASSNDPAEAMSIPAAQGEVVLVVEDNEGLRRVVMRQLAELGYRAVEAEDAATALALLKTEKIDLLFTDIVMPGGVDGVKLARLAIDGWPRVKVVLTSGFPGASINGNLGPLAASARLLSKPYRKDELARALCDALNGARREI